MRTRKITNIIRVTTTELKKNLYGNYLQLLNDSLSDEMEYFEMDANRLTDAIQTIQKHGFTDLFKEGYTMMLLPEDDFNFVDQWFNRPGSAEEELEVRIYNEDQALVETVKHEDLSY